jgi:hypothetical protein
MVPSPQESSEPCFIKDQLERGIHSNAFKDSGTESANILRSADILSAVGGGTFCHPSSAKRLAGQYVRHPAARKMHALRQA